MPTEIVCACGRKLQLGEHHAGRKVRCPACDAEHSVPEPGTAAPATTSPTRRSRLPSLILLALLIPGLVGAAVTAWWYLKKKPEPTVGAEVPESALLPRDAAAFLRFRVAEMWKTPAAKAAIDKARQAKQIDDDPAATLERRTGLKPEEVERFGVVVLEAGNPPVGWSVIKTFEPYSPKVVLAKLRDSEQMTHEGRTYHFGTDPDGREMAVSFVSPKLIVAGPEFGVRLCLTRLADGDLGREGAVAPLLARYEEPTHLLGAIDPSRLREPPPELAALAPAFAALKEVRVITATGNLDKETLLKAVAKCDSEGAAKKTLDTMGAQKSLVSLYLIGMRFKGGEQGRSAASLSKLLGQLTFAQEGDEVTATLKTDPDTLAAAFAALPALAAK